MSADQDPRLAIAANTPPFAESDAAEVAATHYGLAATATELVSERDQNFHLDTKDQRQFVLKIASALEAHDVTRFQVDVLQFIARTRQRKPLPLCTPEVVETIHGERCLLLSDNGSSSDAGPFLARLVTYVPGRPIGDDAPSGSLCRSMGRALARLGDVLAEYPQSPPAQSLLWDMQQALALRHISHHIPKTQVRNDVQMALDEFERYVWPKMSGLRAQLVHSDFNPDNVLVELDNGNEVSGVIDFGDMLHAPLIADVAIAASYLRCQDGNPLERIVEFIAAYHEVTPLTRVETNVLFDMIKARLCASIAILYWRASFRDADDPYLRKLVDSESDAEEFLARLADIPRENAQQMFSQVCASAETR